MKELFYIKGNQEKPEDVREALLEKYPNAVENNVIGFNNSDYVYYVHYGKFDCVQIGSSGYNLIREYGTEIFIANKREFVEKVMYQPIQKTSRDCCTIDRLYDSVEELIEEETPRYEEFAVGYRKVKVYFPK